MSGPRGPSWTDQPEVDGYHEPGPTCPRGCESWARCDEPEECSATNRQPDERDGERYGTGVCATGACIEPCGDYGGCKR